MGLLDYYRQFSGMTDEEVREQLHAEAAERKRLALARVEPLDLSHTTWPGLPDAAVVTAITYAARRGLHGYADAAAGGLRAELAQRLGVPRARVVVGNGAAQLLEAAAQELLEPGDELLAPWPTYPLYPLLARRAGAQAVPGTSSSVRDLPEAVTDRTRVVLVCSPNDPTGELAGVDDLRALLETLPERAVVLLDEALVDFADAQARDAALALAVEHPRLLVVRTFSKAWGLAGLRCGYAVGGPGAEPLLERLAPPLGVGELVQAGALEALRHTADHVERRTRAVAAERGSLTRRLRGLGLDVTDSQANFLWVAAPGLDGAALHDHLHRASIATMSGRTVGDPARVRITVRDAAASDRLLRVLEAVA